MTLQISGVICLLTIHTFKNVGSTHTHTHTDTGSLAKKKPISTSHSIFTEAYSLKVIS